MGQESVHELVALLTRLRIACDLRTSDAVYYATDAEAVDGLHREWTLRTRTGFDAKWLNPGDSTVFTRLFCRFGVTNALQHFHHMGVYVRVSLQYPALIKPPLPILTTSSARPV